VIAGDDALPWDLLHDGTIVELERDLADEVTVWVECAFIRVRFADGGKRFKLRLAACTVFEYTPYDEPPIVELAAIASSEPSIVEAKFEDGVMQVWGAAGVLRASYASLALELDTGRALPLDELRRQVRAYWDEWRKKTAPRLAHPAVAAAYKAAADPAALRALLPALVAAWRTERTSELATTIEIIYDRIYQLPVVWLELATVDSWIATRLQDPAAALAEFVRRATRGEPHDPGDAAYAAKAALWAGFARCAAALLADEPDPRIGRAIEDILHHNSSDFWFRIDQVSHVADSFPPPHDEPSFADHAFALLEVHADRGSAHRLHELAKQIAIECDCNGAEMAERLHALADRIAPRFGADTRLAEEIATTLRVRTPADRRP
jgi:hypothetical protein